MLQELSKTNIKEQSGYYQVKFKNVNADNENFYNGRITYISETGMFIVSDIEFEEDTYFEIYIFVNGLSKIPFKVEGKVTWIASKRIPRKEIFGMGIEIYHSSLASLMLFKKEIFGFYTQKRDFKNIFNLIKENTGLMISWAIIVFVFFYLIFTS